jgi:hypothetical protein
VDFGSENLVGLLEVLVLVSHTVRVLGLLKTVDVQSSLIGLLYCVDAFLMDLYPHFVIGYWLQGGFTLSVEALLTGRHRHDVIVVDVLAGLQAIYPF